MLRTWITPKLLLAVGLVVWIDSSLAEKFLYRYVNEDGVTVIHYSIPPEYVHSGYEILNRDGSVFKVVPRSLTQEELANRSGDV